MASPFPGVRSLLEGAAGAIEILAHLPVERAARAVAVVAHPHPLFGGTMDNKVVSTLARAFFDGGAATYRFNFRGAGASAGVHDEGRGETADMLQVIAHAQREHPGLPLWLAGFSFGGAVTLAASEQLSCSEMVLVAPAFGRLTHWANVQAGGNPPETAIIIHGENDDTVPLAASLDWARPRNIPVIVVPGADHFFHQRLHIIKRLATRLAAGAS
jgi:uncharacterized protein